MVQPVSTTALLVEELLGSTLSSVIKAQGLVSTQLADFIEKVGFEETTNDDGTTGLRARTFSFEFERAEVGEDDEVVRRKVTASLPLLSIVSLPALTIDSADLDLDLRLVATDPAPSGGPKPLPGQRTTAVHLWAIPWKPPPPTGTGTGTTTTSTAGAMKVRVTLRRMDVPMGIERLERLLAEGYVEETEEPE